MSKINEHTYIVTHYFPWESNSLIIKASDSEVVLIDTPYNDDATRLMYQWIRENLKPAKMVAMNTGFHIDNLGGNGYLLQNDINIYGSDLTVKLIDERSTASQKQILSWLVDPKQIKYRIAYEEMKFSKPNIVYNINDGLNLRIGQYDFELYYPGESHSPDNVVVYIKQLKLLFGSCILKSKESADLGFTGDANMSEWPLAIKRIKQKYSDAQIVIPHHGIWGGQDVINHTLRLFQ